MSECWISRHSLTLLDLAFGALQKTLDMSKDKSALMFFPSWPPYIYIAMALPRTVNELCILCCSEWLLKRAAGEDFTPLHYLSQPTAQSNCFITHTVRSCSNTLVNI